jgi:Zn-dependent membrane protease YugP
MLLIIIGLLLLLLIFAPNMWVKHILKKYHKPLPNMPGTGGELAIHLLQQYQLDHVAVEQTDTGGDHYSPSDNAVRLSPEVYSGKSLSAVAVAAHEVGHAIQFNRKEPVSLLRTRYLGSAHRVQKVGVMLLMTMPFIGSILHFPQISLLLLVVGIITLLSSVLLYAAVLPEEWDASFTKALPILEKGQYVPADYMPAIRQVLTACALTYVAAALADVLRLWRWLRFIR